MNSRALSLGISPCPNDTFIFYGLLHGQVETGALRFDPIHLEDVETLNQWALTGRLDVSKISIPAFARVCREYVLLTSGGAMGRKCGPLLVCRRGEAPDLRTARIALPGELTTAATLLTLYAPACANTFATRFDTIMPMIADGRADCGVIIHESRFTYPEYGLELIADLGQWWEQQHNLPLPLGGICVRRSLGTEAASQIEQCIRASIRWALSHPESTWSYIKQHAQEMTPGVIQGHIALYVNDYSVHLDNEGKEAVATFLRLGRKKGLLPEEHQPCFWEQGTP